MRTAGDVRSGYAYRDARVLEEMHAGVDMQAPNARAPGNAGGRSHAREGAPTLCMTLATLCTPGCIFGVPGLPPLPKLHYG